MVLERTWNFQAPNLLNLGSSSKTEPQTSWTTEKKTKPRTRFILSLLLPILPFFLLFWILKLVILGIETPEIWCQIHFSLESNCQIDSEQWLTHGLMALTSFKLFYSAWNKTKRSIIHICSLDYQTGDFCKKNQMKWLNNKSILYLINLGLFIVENSHLWLQNI